jgi:origin recognition complex subunit 5
MEKCVNKLSKKIKCRNSIIGFLYSLLADEPMFPNLFIYGHVSSGKSYIIRHLLEYLNYNISIINCLEHVSNKSMFERILIDLAPTKLTPTNGYKLPIKCENFVDFVSEIQCISKENSKPIVIVLEKCEKLRQKDGHLLPALLRLGELTQVNMCTIFTSDVIWEKYIPKLGLYEPITIYFPQYNKNEMTEILLYLTQPDYCSDQFYNTYLNLFLSIYFRFCRDLNELRYMAEKNFVKYIEPVQSKTIEENDVSALWRNISNTFKENLEVIYLRVSTDDFDQQYKASSDIESVTKLALSFELPCYSKYLLIAAYLASYNPAKEDKRLFVKAADTKKKKVGRKKKITKMIIREGPQSFTLNRLLAIFCSIIDTNIDLNAVLLSQVPSMCQLGLLSMIGDYNIDEAKYKCCVSFEFIMVISRNVGFELKKYLYDFLH